jgi:hypothetical protein
MCTLSKIAFDEAEAKAKVERAIHQPEGAIWRAFWRRDLNSETRRCLEGAPDAMSWEEIKDMAKEVLRLQRDIELELSGADLEPPEETSEGGSPREMVGDEPHTPKGLTERTKARARAMSELSAFRTGIEGEPPQIEPVKAKVRAAGGRKDRTLHRWVVSLDIEVWVPVEEVARVYRNLQQQFIDEQGVRTEEGTYEVARFVWRELRRNDGSRLTWPSLLERWKQEHPNDNRFKTYNNFRQYFVRGEQATVPRYKWPTIQTSPEQEVQIKRTKERWIARLRGYEQKHGNQFLEEHRTL